MLGATFFDSPCIQLSQDKSSTIKRSVAVKVKKLHTHTHTHTHTRLTALCPWLPGWAGTRKVKPIWILLEQETVSGSGISLGHMQICTSPQTDNHALPATQPTASKHFFNIKHLSHSYYWRYVALVIVLWRPALSSSASVTALRWEPVNVHV